MTKKTLPSLVESHEIMANQFARFKRDLLQTSDEHSYFHYCLELKPQAVIILGVAADGRLLVIEEYRHPTGRMILGIAGGLVEEGEDLFVAAARELLEETGYTADSFETIGQIFGFPSVTGQKATIVRARNVHKVQEPSLEPSEFITPHLLTLEELHAKMDGDHVDSHLCSALFFHNHKKL